MKYLKLFENWNETQGDGFHFYDSQKIERFDKTLRGILFEELKTDVSLNFFRELYSLNNREITGLVNDLIVSNQPEEIIEIIENILEELRNMNINQEKYDEFNKSMADYVDSVKKI